MSRKTGTGSLRPDQGSQRTRLWMGWGLLRDDDRAGQLLLGADEHALLSSQFTQSALDCMGVEVGRLRAFLQVRAQLGLFELLFLLSSPLLIAAPVLTRFPIRFLFPE